MSIRKIDARPTKQASDNDTSEIKKDDGFAASILIGFASNDGAAGGLMGGNLLGGIIGDALNGADTSY